MLLTLLSFCLLLLGQGAAQQCRLVAPQNFGAAPAPVSSQTPTQTVNVASFSSSSTQSSSATSSTPTLAPFNYGTDPVRGVNLGGWFVLEPWITPSLFQSFNNSNIDHWESWITEDDFQAIKAAGLNHVRMQIGYWSVPVTSADTNYTLNQYGLHVILDLHGAPGSQNGYDNSGHLTNDIAWAMGGMIDILELINEPGAFVVRDAAGGALKVMIMDGFLGVNAWQDFLTYPSAQGVLMDTHEYQIFNYPQLQLSFDEHIDYSCQVLSNLSSYAKSNIYTIIGEWTTAPTDCAKWLNGRGSGQPTFGSCNGMSGNMSTFSDDYKTFLRKYYEAQVAIGEAIQGWVYWTWKVEDADDWSYQRGLEGGWIPQDPTDRLYPNICTNN
ncbi:glycoside hydrolase superfamily [Irpex lacteus]|nr:glycoside hydrolase superfamily [Irpex lacteus]